MNKSRVTEVHRTQPHSTNLKQNRSHRLAYCIATSWLTYRLAILIAITLQTLFCLRSQLTSRDFWQWLSVLESWYGKIHFVEKSSPGSFPTWTSFRGIAGRAPCHAVDVVDVNAKGRIPRHRHRHPRRHPRKDRLVSPYIIWLP